jgi:hypothetical protein
MAFESPSGCDPAPANRFEVSPEVVKKIEAFDERNLHNTEKESLILILAGAKPATEVSFQQGLSESKEDFLERVQSARQLFQESGIAIAENEKTVQVKTEDTGKEQPWTVVDFFLSRDSAKAEQAKALAYSNRPEDEENFGLLMGYPKTAVESYIKSLDEKYSQEPELPEEIDFAEYMEFKNFIISKDHWQDELETVKQWAETIRTVAPDLYREITNIRKRIDEVRTEHPVEFRKMLLDNGREMRHIKSRDPELYGELEQEREKLIGSNSKEG